MDALEKAKQAGKLIAIAYSGDTEDLSYAINMDRFDGFMASLNICDQHVLNEQLTAMQGNGLIAKRPAANHPWRFDSVPTGHYCEVDWHRWKAMNPPSFDMEWGELSMRFALSFPGITSAVVGTSSIEHLKQNIEWSANGALDASQVLQLRECFKTHDKHWWAEI